MRIQHRLGVFIGFVVSVLALIGYGGLKRLPNDPFAGGILMFFAGCGIILLGLATFAVVAITYSRDEYQLPHKEARRANK